MVAAKQLYRNPPTLRGWSVPAAEKERCRRTNTIYRASTDFGGGCFEKCPVCYLGNMAVKKPTTSVPIKTARKMVDQSVSCGAEAISLSGDEPLHYPRFREIVSYISSLGKIPLIFTSGTQKMTDELAIFLFENNATMIVKRNSYDDAALQDSMLGWKGAAGRKLSRIENTISRLMGAGFNKSEPTRLAIETVMGTANILQLPALFRFARKNNIYPFFELIVPAQYVDKKLMLDRNEAKKAFVELLKIDQEEFGHTWVPRPPHVAAGCDYFHSAIYIRSDEKVQLCPSTNIVVGDLKAESLVDILGKESTMQLRNIAENVEGNCMKCSYHVDLGCYGCRGRAFYETKNHNAPDPICWMGG